MKIIVFCLLCTFLFIAIAGAIFDLIASRRQNEINKFILFALKKQGFDICMKFELKESE